MQLLGNNDRLQLQRGENSGYKRDSDISIDLLLTLDKVVVVFFVFVFVIIIIFLPNNMISNFLRSTRNLSSVHSGSGSGWGPLRSSSDPGRGESVLRSLLEPWSDCCKYPLKASHWAAMALRSNFSSGQVVCGVHGAPLAAQQTHQPSPREKFHVSSGREKKKKEKKQDSSQKHFLKQTSPWVPAEVFKL